MEMYQLWDVASGNRLGEFYTKGEALATVRVIIGDDPTAVETLTLLVEDARGDLAEISSGHELLALLQQPA